MTKTQRPDPFLLADNRAVDFLNSIAAPNGHEIEWINNGDDLLNWLEQTGLVKHNILEHYRQSYSATELNKVAKKARELREWFRTFTAQHAGQALGKEAFNDLKLLNDYLDQSAVYRQIEMASMGEDVPEKKSDASTFSPLKLTEKRRWNRPEELLLPIVEAMSTLICTPAFERVKNCEGPKCSLWFLDITKNHTRRWCAMEMCGNRAKAAAFRERQRQKT